MKRDLNASAGQSRRYDLIVIGGGIYGICAAREAARRGLTVCLLERDDFAAATSFNSLKIIHGGLRYLQHGDLRRMRESIVERRVLMSLAPGLIRPLRCLLPTEGFGPRGRWALRAALAVNDLVGFDRDAGLPATHRLPRGRVLGRAETAARIPGLPLDGLSGAAEWHDCLAVSNERLAMAFLRSGVAAGLDCANYAEVTGLVMREGRVTGVNVLDQLDGSRIAIDARYVLNAAGPWVDAVLRRAGAGGGRAAPLFLPSLGLNIVTRRLFDECAVGLVSARRFRDPDALLATGRRTFFVVPWGEYSLIGTRHFPLGRDESPTVGERHVARFLAEINAAYPPAALVPDDVLAVYSGILPAAPGGPPDDVRLAKHPVWRDHAADGFDGLTSVVGVKWTTARRVAVGSIDRVVARLGDRRPAPAEAPLPGGEVMAGITKIPPRLAERYGTIAASIVALAEADPALARPLHPSTPAIGAEVVHAVRHEMARRLADVVVRRTGIGAVQPPADGVLHAMATLMGSELQWTGQRRDAELAHTAAALREMRRP